MKNIKFFKKKDDTMQRNTTIGDQRLSMIWRILKVHGILSFENGWKLSVRVVASISLLLCSYCKDIFLFITIVVNGSLKIPKDVEILTFTQLQLITAYRMYVLIRHREGLKKLVSYITEEFPRWTEEGDMKEFLEKKARRGMWIYYAHLAQLTSVFILLTLRPMLSHTPHALILQTPLGTLPWIPSDRAPWYQLTYIFQIWKNLFAINVAFCMNMLFFTLTVQACAHLDCLARSLEALGSQPDAHLILVKLVNRYNKIRRFTDLLNHLFFALTAVQPLYTGFSVITSLLVFDGTEQSFSFAGIAIAHMLELFIYCYAGDLAAEKSCALADKLFGCRWYELSQRDKRSVLQAVQQCQKPFSIRAGFFGNFSRQMFSTTMKTTYSAWAVINQAK